MQTGGEKSPAETRRALLDLIHGLSRHFPGWSRNDILNLGMSEAHHILKRARERRDESDT